MPAFNYLSTLRENCTPGEACGPEVCTRITCQDIEFPARFGVEFGGTPASIGESCGTSLVSWADITLTSYSFPYYGTPIVVEYVEESSCVWCLPDVGAPFTMPLTEPPGVTEGYSTDCGEITGECADNRYLETTSGDFGWQTHPGEIDCVQYSVCEECDMAVYHDLVTYESASMPSIFTDVRVTIVKKTAAEAPHFADGLLVNVSKRLSVGGKMYAVTTESEYLIELDEDCRYDCGELGLSPYPGCEDYPLKSWACSLQPMITVASDYERFFPGATVWEDIIDEEIPGTDINTCVGNNECDDFVSVFPFFGTDHAYPCVVGEHPPGCFGDDFDDEWEYEQMCAKSSDNFVILRNL